MRGILAIIWPIQCQKLFDFDESQGVSETAFHEHDIKALNVWQIICVPLSFIDCSHLNGIDLETSLSPTSILQTVSTP